MAKLSHTDSRRMYSWWWDSHISPKNSKWLQENLTGKVFVVIEIYCMEGKCAENYASLQEFYIYAFIYFRIMKISGSILQWFDILRLLLHAPIPIFMDEDIRNSPFYICLSISIRVLH